MVKARGSYACPSLQKYPLNTRARISSAKAYYPRSNTAKCAGGKTRICRAAKRAGFMNRPKWREWCK